MQGHNDGKYCRKDGVLLGGIVEGETDDLKKLEDPKSEVYQSLKPDEVGLNREQMEKANAIVVYDIRKLGGENAAEGEYSQTGESPGKERKGEKYSFKLQLIHQKKFCC
ncbi:MAG: hypothetical protein ACP5E4_00475 [Candidatus Aenigmatarchaeota archaeon]